jgi:polyhydroxyalkanoate synthase subunit PhaC
MATEQKAERVPVKTPDPAKLADVWTSVLVNGAEVIRAAAERSMVAPAPASYDPFAPVRAFSDFTKSLWSNPAQLMETQQKLFGEWIALWTGGVARALGQVSDPVLVPEKGDRRFNDPAWNQAFFNYLKQAYLLTTRQSVDLIAKTDLDPATRTRVDFFARQFLNAISPANFVFSNPEAIQKAMESGGVSLLGGLANMLEDAASPSGLVKRRSADDFEIGVNIAATPGGIIFQNEMMQFIHYEATAAEVYRRPLLYIPPLVNKYYVLDLQAKSSMIKWLVGQGRDVFVISWVNPGPELSGKGIGDYCLEGPVAALQNIERLTGERTVDIFGFCMGGTLAAITAAYLSATGQAERVGSLSLIGTLLDFRDTGEWATFYEDGQMDAFERYAQKTGVIGADKLQALFSVVRANDLIWASVVNHYLLDREAPASDLLFWFADGSRIPQTLLLEYGKALLRGNLLKEHGGISVGKVPIDLKAIKAPVCMISLKDDHVSGWRATYAGAKLFGGETTFMLGGSGHNAGLINPPAANKHGYWTNKDLPEAPEQWFDGAEQKSGSWWPAWQEWLANHHGEKVPARALGSDELPVLEAAPGSYVLVK